MPHNNAIRRIGSYGDMLENLVTLWSLAINVERPAARQIEHQVSNADALSKNGLESSLEEQNRRPSCGAVDWGKIEAQN
ncbi:MAG: hypothetical protein CM15mP1_2080 [Methanobacteriota archaeon]|nr:MAG: hypothetical protein CM15mP1_2080 [Euryarchaeota archaeon]